jgi:hypothetical protein
MSYIVLFVIVFVGGPLAFRGLTRGVPSSTVLRQLALFSVLCAVIGLTLRYGLADLWGRNPLVTGGGLVFIWGGWIGLLACGTQALRHVEPCTRMRRLAAVMGATGTTVPWFGLASASLMIG